MPASAGDEAEREAAAALVGECPQRLHEEDRLVLLPGVAAVRAWWLVWLMPCQPVPVWSDRIDRRQEGYPQPARAPLNYAECE